MSSSAGPTHQLSYRSIFRFWFPLGVMWLMMAAEQPALAAVIARMPFPELNLAAFGVVWALALVIESPVIQMLSAATALAGNICSYRRLISLMHFFAITLTGIHLLVGLTPLFGLIVEGILQVPPDIGEASRIPFLIMTPFTAAVGYRRLWQGTLIRNGKTWIVPVTMVTRLATIAVVLIAGYSSTRVSGAALASTAISVGVVIAAVTAWVLNRRMVLPILQASGDSQTLGWRELIRFYVPLSLTTVVFLLSQPALTFGMARAFQPVVSLAVFPVVNGFVFLWSSVGVSFQESAIALLKRSPRSYSRLSRFAVGLSLFLTGAILIAALTPVGQWWFRVVGGLSPRLMSHTALPLLLMAPVPGLVTFKVWSRARYVAVGKTAVLAKAIVAYTATLFVAVYLGSAFLPVVGVTVAAAALSVAQVVENGFLIVRAPGEALFAARAQG